jgi:hypothetical protein
MNGSLGSTRTYLDEAEARYAVSPLPLLSAADEVVDDVAAHRLRRCGVERDAGAIPHEPDLPPN